MNKGPCLNMNTFRKKIQISILNYQSWIFLVPLQLENIESLVSD